MFTQEYKRLSKGESEIHGKNVSNVDFNQRFYRDFTRKVMQANFNPEPRPPNAFILFCRDARNDLKSTNGSMSNIELSKLLGKMWKESSDEIHTMYKQQAAKLQDEFKSKYPNYFYMKSRKKKEANQVMHETPAKPNSLPTRLYNLVNDWQNRAVYTNQQISTIPHVSSSRCIPTVNISQQRSLPAQELPKVESNLEIKPIRIFDSDFTFDIQLETLTREDDDNTFSTFDSTVWPPEFF